MQIGQHGIAFFESRNIDLETAVKLGAYTASLQPDGKTTPDPHGKVIAFPYFENGARVACKYRGPGKKFWQDAGGRRTFYNADVLDEPSLRDGAPLVVVEGELDCHAVIDSGHRLAVSVPDGAPSIPTGKKPDELDEFDAEADAAGKFEFVYNNRDRLKTIRRFVIATDADGPGQRLAAELVRRLGPARCSFVSYPDEEIVQDGDTKRRCKDLNEVKIHFGSARVIEIINAAKPYPVRGVYKLSDYPPDMVLKTVSVGWEGWQQYLRLFPGEFMVVTGIPSHGKSSWTLELVHNLAQNHMWKPAIFSPEMRTVPMLRDSFRRMRIGHKAVLGEESQIAVADRWINENIVFIDADPKGMGDDDEPFDVDWLIARAIDAVLLHGIRVLLIDPWNEIEHARGRNENMTDYIARSVRALKRFGRMYDVMVIVVAHPTKDIASEGKVRTPRLYDIEGSATWYNKADHGIVVERPNRNGKDSTVYIQKVRFMPSTGVAVKMTMTYDQSSARFTPVECGLAL